MPAKLVSLQCDSDGKPIYTRRSFAARIGVTEKTLRKWASEGMLIPAEVRPSGRCIYTEDQAVAYFRAHKKWKHSKQRI